MLAFISHPDCLRHDAGPDHPESPLRLHAIDNHLIVVKRPIGFAGRIRPFGVVHFVGGCVPSAYGQVESTGESDRVVDHDNFLVMAGADRQDVVETHGNLFRRVPGKIDRRE